MTFVRSSSLEVNTKIALLLTDCFCCIFSFCFTAWLLLFSFKMVSSFICIVCGGEEREGTRPKRGSRSLNRVVKRASHEWNNRRRKMLVAMYQT